MLAVEVKNLTHEINNKKILNNIEFNLTKDSISCILGPSGSGKTTLLKLIAGLEKVQSGEILINGEEVSSTKKHLPTEKRKIGFLFQDYALFPHLTVKQNLEYPINYKNSNKSNIQFNTSNEKTVPIIIISDPVGVDKINLVTQNLKKTSFLKKEISVIRIEEDIG